MSTSDTLQFWNIVATVLAVILAPIIALWAGGKLQTRANVRQEQLKLLSVLLSLRHRPLSPEIFRALNLIDAVFVDDRDVREMWSKYYSALTDQNLQNLPGFTIREDKRRDLLIAILKRLGLEKKISTSDLLRTYVPTAVHEADMLEIWERIKLREDLRPEFVSRGIGFPEFVPPYYPPVPPQPPQQPQQQLPPVNGQGAN